MPRYVPALMVAVSGLCLAAQAQNPNATTTPTPTPAPQTMPPAPRSVPKLEQRGQTGKETPPGTVQEAKTAMPQVAPPAGTDPNPARTPPVAPRTQDTPVPPAIVIPLPPSPTSDVPNRPLTADEAARIALRLQPNVAIARANIAAQQGRTQQVRSGLLPQVTLFGSYTHIETLSTERSGGTATPVSVGGGTGTTGGSSGTGTTGTTGGTGSTGSTSGTGSTSTGGVGTTGGSTSGSGTGTTGSGSTGTGSSGTGGTSTGSGGTGSSGSSSTGGGSSTGTSTGTTSGGGATTVTQLGSSSVASGEGTVGQATLRQLIYDFNHTRDLVRQSQSLERAALQNLTRVQYDLVLQVKQAYYQLTQYTQLVRVNEANVANRQEQLDLANARLNSGLGLPQDVVTAQTAKAEAVQQLNVARGLEGIARQNLALLMGIDSRTPLQTANSGEPAIATDDINNLIQTALQRRPEVLQAQEQVRASRYGVSAARTTNAPVISGSLNFTSRGTDFPPGNDSFSVGASIQFSPFDGGLTQGRVKEARANLDATNAALTAAQLAVQTDVTQAYLNLRTAEQRVAATLTEVANAEEGVRIATGRYRSGLGLFLDIINAQAFLLSARTNLVTTQTLVEQNRAALNRAIGTPIR